MIENDGAINSQETESRDLALKVHEAQIRQLYDQTWGGLAGSYIVALGTGVALWGAIPHWKLIVWLGCMALIVVARSLLIVIFHRRSHSGQVIYKWAKLHAIGATAAALLWGLPSFLLWPVDSPVHQLVWPICIVSISASAVAKYCTWRLSYFRFIIFSVVPISFRLLLEGEFVYIVLGLLGLLFTAVLSHTGKEMYDASRMALSVGVRNEALNMVLSEEKIMMGKLNERLQKEISGHKHSQEELQVRNQDLERLNAQLNETKNNLQLTNNELESALANVKHLSGMLPICASCKKIRNDKGYWEQIESYIGERSNAQFSHGICPECKKKLYPELSDPEMSGRRK